MNKKSTQQRQDKTSTSRITIIQNPGAGYQNKNLTHHNQDSMSPVALSTPTPASPEKYNIVEAQDKNSKITFMNMLEVLKKTNE